MSIASTPPDLRERAGDPAGRNRPTHPSANCSQTVRWLWAFGWLGLTGAVWVLVATSPATGALAALAVLVFIAPDLSFLAALGAPLEQGRLPARAVRPYNLMHRPMSALTVAVALGIVAALGWLDPVVVGVVTGSWLAHIAMDRAAGYGLRNPDGSR